MARAPPPGRPRLPDDQRRWKTKRALTSYTVATKKAVVEHLRLHCIVQFTMDTFFPDLPTEKYQGRRVLVLRWARQYDSIAATCASVGGGGKRKTRSTGSATILPLDVELDIVSWINDLRAEGVPVTSLMLRLKALSAAKAAGVQRFRASTGWQRLFKRRHRLSMRSRTRQGQGSPVELDKTAAEFSLTVKAKAAELGVSVIYNAKQTDAFFEYLPAKTLHGTGDKTVWVRCGGKSKERATVMLLGDSNGNKYPPFLVFKSKPSTVLQRREANTRLRHGFGVTVWKEVGPAQEKEGVQVHDNAKGK
ncbi:hypothetical protein PHYSODRAFT_474294 [Phytophthora sojae]|uniref:HTH CENPB-type domain-containing protein n=1 Tax=Phytophthora sojae (strain P6497) TaxID=1094619 RepID=G4YFN3_PHYSP|nr:hypothetical protein PHYSODRAFT_474294 [Phytophthora sojae]EGZ27388.1 hypothetical protein PHYSODRAFT_474294 [Phytophthora sojae]|eukprot:XP_009514663.1 hypothetical protein PHYSODRAFT_474294 [Phytophthora sojae]